VGQTPDQDDAQPLGAPLPPSAVAFIAANRGKPSCDSRLLATLHLVQDAAGYLSPEHLGAVSDLTGVPLARITALATFYHYFRLVPRGRHLISLCLGTACHVKGATAVGQRFMDDLGVAFGGTTPDGQFTLEPTRCLGTCGLAPVVMIDDTLHGEVTAEATPQLLELHLHQAPRFKKRKPRLARHVPRLG